MDENVVTTLNALIHVCLDNRRGYSLEAEGAANRSVSCLLQEMAFHHGQQAGQLDSVLLQLGVNPLHVSARRLGGPRWAGLHDAIIQENMTRAMRSLEETECCTLVSYEIALRSTYLPSPIRAVLSRHHSRMENTLRLLLRSSKISKSTR